MAALKYAHKCLQDKVGRIGNNKHDMMHYYDFLVFREAGHKAANV